MLLSLANELLYIFGNIAMAFAYLRVPVALALLANTYQIVFALLLGLALRPVCPDIAENETPNQILKKGTAIVVASAGTYVLLRS